MVKLVQKDSGLEILQLLFLLAPVLVNVAHLNPQWPFHHTPYVRKTQAVFPLVLLGEGLAHELWVQVGFEITWLE